MKRMGLAGIIAVTLISTTFAFANQNSAVRGAANETQPNGLVLSAMTLIHSDYAMTPDAIPGDIASSHVVIDIRLPEDFAKAHIAGAVNIPERNVLAQIRSMIASPDQPILIYGYSEQQSIRSVVALRLLNYTRVFHVDGTRQFTNDFGS